MAYGTSIICALLAAVSFAFAAVMQQESTQSVTADKSLTIGLLVELLSRKKWLLGLGAMLAGFGLQAVALSFGPVAVVQPIVVTELAFAIPFGILRRHRRAGIREWAGILAVMSGVSIFLLVTSPTKGIYNPPTTQWIESLVPVGGVVAATIALGAARRDAKRAMFLGSAAGLSFGVLAVLTKAVTHLLSADVTKALTTWQVYVAIGVGVVALVVSQSAYQAGPLAFSMPFVGVLEPVVAVIIGDTVLDEQVSIGGGQLALAAAAAALACVGIVLLTTSHTVLSIYEEMPSGHLDGYGDQAPAC